MRLYTGQSYSARLGCSKTILFQERSIFRTGFWSALRNKALEIISLKIALIHLKPWATS